MPPCVFRPLSSEWSCPSTYTHYLTIYLLKICIPLGHKEVPASVHPLLYQTLFMPSASLDARVAGPPTNCLLGLESSCDPESHGCSGASDAFR